MYFGNDRLALIERAILQQQLKSGTTQLTPEMATSRDRLIKAHYLKDVVAQSKL
jgi:hypothetical protein